MMALHPAGLQVLLLRPPVVRGEKSYMTKLRDGTWYYCLPLLLKKKL